MPAVARAMRRRTRVRRTAAGVVVIVGCDCATVRLPVQPEAVLEDVMQQAQALHAEQAPDCPHRQHDDDDER